MTDSDPAARMRDPEIPERLIAGYRRFRETRYAEYRTLFEVLAHQGQHPRVMLITCCDSRIDPALLTGSHPGELFIVRNVANLVPPYDPDGGHHGTSAALEFAVQGLEVSHIVLLGHAHCGGVQALWRHHKDEGVGGVFVPMWMNIARPACLALEARGLDGHQLDGARELEREVVRTSLTNLESFPFVREAVGTRRLSLHGWYFDIEHARLSGLGADGSFVEL